MSDGVSLGIDEEQRLAALRRLGILDTPPEATYDEVVAMIADLLDMPIALVSLVDDDRQWFKAKVGLDVDGTSRDISFCTHAITDGGNDLFVVADALNDPRFAANPLVLGDPAIRFYAGQPVHAPTGEAIGTLCVIDRKPRELDDAGRRLMARFGGLIEGLLAERPNKVSTSPPPTQREASLFESVHDGVVEQDANGRIVRWNSAAEAMLGLTGEELEGRDSADPRWRAVYRDGSPLPGEDHPAMRTLRTKETLRDQIMGVHRSLGDLVWLRVNSTPLADEAGELTGVLTSFTDITTTIASESDATAAPQQNLTEAAVARVRQFSGTLSEVITVLEEELRVAETVIAELLRGSSVRDIVEHSGGDLHGEHFTAALKRLEDARRLARIELFRVLLDQGFSIAEIARVWGLSRQLVSRLLRDA